MFPSILGSVVLLGRPFMVQWRAMCQSIPHFRKKSHVNLHKCIECWCVYECAFHVSWLHPHACMHVHIYLFCHFHVCTPMYPSANWSYLHIRIWNRRPSRPTQRQACIHAYIHAYMHTSIHNVAYWYGSTKQIYKHAYIQNNAAFLVSRTHMWNIYTRKQIRRTHSQKHTAHRKLYTRKPSLLTSFLPTLGSGMTLPAVGSALCHFAPSLSSNLRLSCVCMSVQKSLYMHRISGICTYIFRIFHARFDLPCHILHTTCLREHVCVHT